VLTLPTFNVKTQFDAAFMDERSEQTLPPALGVGGMERG
jgi:hypothetical protein